MLPEQPTHPHSPTASVRWCAWNVRGISENGSARPTIIGDDMTADLPPNSSARAPAGACDNKRVELRQAASLLVRDAMVTAPKTVAADATVDQLR